MQKQQPKNHLNITVGQINPTIGDMAGNIQLMLDVARKAQGDGADVVVFPELSLTGYSPADLLDDGLFDLRLTNAIHDLYQATHETPGLHWVVGLPLRRGSEGRPYYNALQVLVDGKRLHTQFKQLLPTYGVFDERRHFEPGPDEAKVVRIHGVTVGFLICEDGWNADGHEYPVNPFKRLADAAPDLVISINASPSHKGKRQARHELFAKACMRYELPLLYVAQVGGQDQLVFDGASFALNPAGRVVFEAPRFVEASPTLRFDVEQRTFLDLDGAGLPLVPKEGLPVMEFYRQQIVLGIRDYARRCGFTRVLVGSSGGIDSALTLALAADAMGPDNVIAITMPSEYSSEGSVSDSEVLCRNLGVKLHHVSIRQIVDQFSNTLLASTVGERPSGLALENLQARIRKTVEMTYSNQYDCLVLTTGNKSENSVGFFTFGGDGLGGLCVPGDLFKTEVFELCEHINRTAGWDVIPRAIIDKPPSAELAPGQKDSDSLPPYPVLDPILMLLIEGELLELDEHNHAVMVFRELQATEEGAATIAKVQRLIARSEYKRRQAPPIIRVRARAFGTGRQVPITAKQY